MAAERQIEKLMTVFDLEHPPADPERNKGHTRVMVIYDRARNHREFRILTKETSQERLAAIHSLIEATLETAKIA
jgi:hypothetical protein